MTINEHLTMLLQAAMTRSIINDRGGDDSLPPSDRTIAYDGDKLALQLQVILDTLYEYK